MQVRGGAFFRGSGYEADEIDIGELQTAPKWLS